MLEPCYFEIPQVAAAMLCSLGCRASTSFGNSVSKQAVYHKFELLKPYRYSMQSPMSSLRSFGDAEKTSARGLVLPPLICTVMVVVVLSWPKPSL